MSGGVPTLEPLTPIVAFLREPKEKVWGLLLALDAAGLSVRGLDVEVFDDWVRQESRGDETILAPLTLFYPMHRVERVEADETVGPVTACVQRFEDQVGRSVYEVMGLAEAAKQRG